MITDNFILKNHPINILCSLEQIFKYSLWLKWEPETLLHHLPEVANNIAIDKLLAVHAVAANSNVVCTTALAFEKAVTAFCNNVCVMGNMQPPEIEEVSYAVLQIENIIKQIQSPDTKAVFAFEIPGYVASIGAYRSWRMLPEILSFARDMLDFLNSSQVSKSAYEAMDCLIELFEDDLKAMKLIENLQGDSESNRILRRVIGCYLYDPTK